MHVSEPAQPPELHGAARGDTRRAVGAAGRPLARRVECVLEAEALGARVEMVEEVGSHRGVRVAPDGRREPAALRKGTEHALRAHASREGE